MSIALISCLFFSCRKLDIHNEKVLVDRERFFTLPENASPTLQRIVNNLKYQDLQKPFIDKFILNQGYPLWKYAKISVDHGNNNSVLPQNDTLVSIPIVEDGKTYVKSILTVKVNNDVWYKLLEGLKYKDLPLESSASNPAFTIMDLLKMMMEMEYNIFGYNEFAITDEDVINYKWTSWSAEYITRIEFSNGCLNFNYGNYNIRGEFYTESTESVCLNNTAELIYTIEALPEGGGGGPIPDEECKRGFVGIK